MTNPGRPSPYDYSAKTGFKTVGIMVGVGVLLLCGIIGVTELAEAVGGDEPEVSVTKEPAGVDDAVIPAPSATSASPTPSPEASATPSATASVSSAAPRPAVSPKPPAPPKTTKPKAPPSDDEPDDVYYANCAEARADGAAPLYRGNPGYRSALDRDGDGVACES